MWKNVKKMNPDLLLMHARAASLGVGSPKINKNNHPFVSKDCTTALIHNGRIPDIEYGQLKKQYAVSSDCDSEMFLRVFEHGKAPVDGIKDIWSYMHRSHMAVAIGEHLEDSRRLWLFRNTHRPLWLADMRDALGQVFFFSDPDIWDEATAVCQSAWNYLNKVKLYNLSTEIIWCFNLDSFGKIDLQKFKICIKDNVPWQTDKEKFEIKPANSKIEVISGLDENEEVQKKTSTTELVQDAQFGTLYNPDLSDHENDDNLFPDTSDNKKNLNKLNEQVSEIGLLLQKISLEAESLSWENLIDRDNFVELFTSLSGVEMELQGTLRLLEACQH